MSEKDVKEAKKGNQVAPIQSALASSGYFTQRIHAGERPVHGYPENHLPVTTGARMEVRTSFMVARASHR